MTRPRPTTHAYPPPDTGQTPCCGKYLTQLAIKDKVAIDPSKVTCGRAK